MNASRGALRVAVAVLVLVVAIAAGVQAAGATSAMLYRDSRLRATVLSEPPSAPSGDPRSSARRHSVQRNILNGSHW